MCVFLKLELRKNRSGLFCIGMSSNLMQPLAVGHSSTRARLLSHQLTGLSVFVSPPLTFKKLFLLCAIGMIPIGSHLTFCTSVRRHGGTPASVQWISKACQGFGAQHDVASCRKRESREKAKQDIFRSVRGAAPVLLSALGGQRTRGSGLAVLLSPLLCPGPALLSVGHVLLYNTPLFPHDIKSNGLWNQVQRFLHTSCKTAEFALLYFMTHNLEEHKPASLNVYYKKQDEIRNKM